MKQTYFAIAFVTTLICSSCTNTQSEDLITPVPVPELTASQKRIITDNNNFGLDLWKEMVRQAPNENDALSPLSMQTLLSMIANGDNGEIRREILQSLNVDNIDELNGLNKNLAVYLPKCDPGVDVRTATSVWSSPGLKLNRDFRGVISEYYDAQYFSIDMTTSDFVNKVNNWCKSKTNGMIKDYLSSPYSSGTMVSLMNALYFDGKWTNPFNTKNTNTERFYQENGEVITMPIMHGGGKLAVNIDENRSIVKLPYGNGNYEMMIVMPTGSTISEYVGSSEFMNLTNLSFSETMVKLSMPKFEYSQKDSYLEILKRAGLGSISENGLTQLIENMSGIPVGDIKQRIDISINEEGSKVASASSNEITWGTPEITEIEINRPFIYMIRESATGTLIAIGRKMK